MHQNLFYYYFAIFSKYHGRNTNGLATLTAFSFEIFREFSVKNRFWGQHYLPSWPDDISKHGSHLQVFCTYFFPDLADFLLHYDEIVVEGEDEDGDDPADQSNEDDSSEEDGEWTLILSSMDECFGLRRIKSRCSATDGPQI